ncbi:RagB/SusD family nutrient uptake outer membrane protein [Flavobacterium collinsii]|uniref:RagB/SusD family nutrient uptake outer membrane protein n=1 Tax=Flavobacterium collinsii TaxID=1114861 RepID=UPI003756DFB6
MKKIFLFIFLAAALSLASCQDDFLEKMPKDAYSDASLWSSKADATAALNGCYAGWESGANIIGDDCFTDNGFDQFGWDGYEPMASGLISPGDEWFPNFWSYKTIQRCNWFLSNVDKTPVSSLNEDLKNRMKSEVRFLRAYQYYKMTVYYGDVPLVKTSLTPAESKTISRTPKEEVVAFIISELNEITSLLPVNYSGSDIGRITKGAALGLKARIQLIQGDYAGASATSAALMTAPFTYTLFPKFEELFRPINHDNQETLLNCQSLKDLNSEWYPIAYAPKSKGGWSSYVPTQSLVDTYETINGKTIEEDAAYDPLQPYKKRDPRLDMSIIRPGSLYMGSYFNPYEGDDDYNLAMDNTSQTGYNLKKYISNLDDYRGTDFGTDIDNVGGAVMVIRYAEVLLTYAEAKIELNQLDQSVYDAINKVRSRAGMPNVDKAVYSNQTKMRELIRRERRVELAFEGLRFVDTRRWKIAEQVMPGTVKGILEGSVDASNGNLTLKPNTTKVVTTRVFSNPKHYVLPIKQKEIDINKNLKQNPSY